MFLPLSRACVWDCVISHVFHQCSSATSPEVVAGRQIRMRKWMWLQDYLINNKESPEMIMYHQWKTRQRGGRGGTGDSDAGENQFVNQSLDPFISLGLSIYLLYSASEEAARRPGLVSLSISISHHLPSVSTSISHPLSLPSPINLSLLPQSDSSHPFCEAVSSSGGVECACYTHTHIHIYRHMEPGVLRRQVIQTYLLIRSRSVTFQPSDLVVLGLVTCFWSGQQRSECFPCSIYLQHQQMPDCLHSVLLFPTWFFLFILH